MKEFKYVITDEMGIHARPAGLLVKEAKAFSCAIKMEKDGRSVDCKGIMGVMSLGAKKGHEVTLTAQMKMRLTRQSANSCRRICRPVLNATWIAFRQGFVWQKLR